MSKPSRREPWEPADYTEADIYAMQALAAGVASADQQKRALKWIVDVVAGTYDETYFGDSERNSSYAQGKRYVGRALVRAVNMPSTAINKQTRTDERDAKSRR